MLMIALPLFEGKAPRTVNNKFVYEFSFVSATLSPKDLVDGINPVSVALKSGGSCLLFSKGGVEYATREVKDEESLHFFTIVYWSATELSVNADGKYTLPIEVPKCTSLQQLCDAVLTCKSVSKVRVMREFIPQGLLQETIDTTKELVEKFNGTFVGSCENFKPKK